MRGRVSDVTVSSRHDRRGDGRPLRRRTSCRRRPLAEGDNHLHVVATDALGRIGGAEVIVTRDSTPPSIEMTAPETISRRRGAQATVTASDSVALERVVVTANGVTLGTFTQATVAVDLTAPESLAVGARWS